MQQGQVATDGGHHADARVRIAEPGVHMHSAGDEAPQAFLERDREPFVAFLRRRQLGVPRREGMGRCGHHCAAMPFGGVDHQSAGFHQCPPHLRHRLANTRVGLDLGAEELRHDLVRRRVALAVGNDRRIRIADKVATVRVDQEELLFDAEGDGNCAVVASHDNLHVGLVCAGRRLRSTRRHDAHSVDVQFGWATNELQHQS